MRPHFGRSKLECCGIDEPIYAISDIHGQIDLLERALEWIAVDCKQYEQSTVVFCGDYIDYGPESKAVLDRLMNGPEENSMYWVILIGNHEHMMFYYDVDGLDLMDWVKFCGLRTLKNYGFGSIGGFDREKFTEHREFIRRMSVSLEDQHRVFVHAGIKNIGRGNYTLMGQSEIDMMWIKPAEMDANWPTRLKKMLVHGHTPFDRGVPGRRICIDGGAGLRNGHLKVAKFMLNQRELVSMTLVG